MAKKSFCIFLDEDLKEAAETEFNKMGVKFSTGVSMLLKDIVVNKQPFGSVGAIQYSVISGSFGDDPKTDTSSTPQG